jgi:putative nucleotidyltransferase with HDIG domain
MKFKKDNLFNSPAWHRLYLTLVFVATSIALYFSLPEEGRFRYEFQKGRPWMHETLIAPFNFAIMKPDKVINAERDSTLHSLIPYFTYRNSVSTDRMNALSLKIDDLVRREITEILYSRIIKEKILAAFEKVYRAGIIELDISNYPYLTSKKQILAVKNNIGEKVPLNKVYSLKSAYSEIVSGLNNLKESDNDFRLIIEKLRPEDYINVNMIYDSKKTDEEKHKILENISTTRGIVQEGERIVSKGDVITPEIFQILESLKYVVEKSRGDLTKYYLIIIGKMIFIAVLLITLFLFIYNIRHYLLKSKRDITFILIMMTLMIYSCKFVNASGVFPIYIVPFAVLALIIRTFLDARLAIFVNTITTLIVGFMVPNGYEFVLLSIPVGSIAVISQTKLQKREQIILTSLIIFICYSITYIGISLIQEANINSIDWGQLKWFLINAALTLITYLLLFLLEKSFGFVSDVTLIELSYSTQKLLRKLAEEAPGTFQHSLQVANLAEEAVVRLGGNPLLARAGAMYHDVGKITDPQYYIENQVIGLNPHDQHSNEESAKIIIGHVPRGIELARKNKIPEQVIDFIRTHHGTTKPSYYYNKMIGLQDNEIDEKMFTYPGPLPSSRETAILMLADSIEAASRSLETITIEKFKELIDAIFKQKIDAGQMNNAPLTFKDITLLKEVFLEKLQNIYHVRVSYPNK